MEETGDAGTDSTGDTGMDSTGVKYDIVPSDVALEYRQYFQEILIDEYQDSNLVQEYLLSAISGEVEGHYNRFMVGDVKQSIYKFRLARPELSWKIRHLSGEWGSVPDRPGEELPKPCAGGGCGKRCVFPHHEPGDRRHCL